MAKDIWYKSSKDLIGSFKAIKLNNNDIEVNSKHGFIWQYNQTTYKACFTNHRLYNKHKAANNPKASLGDECIITFPYTELDKFLKILKIKKNRSAMLDRANSFGTKHHS